MRSLTSFLLPKNIHLLISQKIRHANIHQKHTFWVQGTYWHVFLQPQTLDRIQVHSFTAYIFQSLLTSLRNPGFHLPKFCVWMNEPVTQVHHTTLLRKTVEVPWLFVNYGEFQKDTLICKAEAEPLSDCLLVSSINVEIDKRDNSQCYLNAFEWQSSKLVSSASLIAKDSSHFSTTDKEFHKNHTD